MNTISEEYIRHIHGDEYGDISTFAPQVKVSVLMLTYNHGPFIEQAIDSVLTQTLSSNIELLIGDDASTDDTLAKCQAKQKAYPNIIRLISGSKNVGVVNNFLRLYSRARGEYVALLEGDDYWTDIDKLKKQVALLDSNPGCSLCGSKTTNMKTHLAIKSLYGCSDFMRRYGCHTSTAVFRRSILTTFPAILLNVVSLDSFLFALILQHGDCVFIDEYLSYYRRHSGGVWNGKTMGRQRECIAQFTDQCAVVFSTKYARELRDRELWLCAEHCNIDLSNSWFKQVNCSWVVIQNQLPRILNKWPLHSVPWLLGIFFRSLAFLYQRIRRRAALRNRISSFVAFCKGTTAR